MACPTCQRRSALVAAIAPAIDRQMSFTRHGLLELLALPDERLLAAAKIDDPARFLRGLQPAPATDAVPTALCRHDPGYPPALAQLPSAPAVLYASCPAERLAVLLATPTVAILGSRRPTAYANRIATELARELAGSGVALVSGMNAGLEGHVHRAALKNSNPNNIAVMAGGADVAFPSNYAAVQRDMLARAVALSELPPKFRPRPWSFIASQRTIAALADVIVVVEPGHSCALLAAEIASGLGAEVAVVPGRLTDPGGKWLCALLQDGARPVSCGRDVLELL